MDKVIRNGNVAVLVSPEFGAGWYTWNQDIPELLFDPTIVDLVLNKNADSEIMAYATLKYPNAYLGGVYNVVIQWVPIGSKFRINEYDGYETLELEKDITWFVA